MQFIHFLNSDPFVIELGIAELDSLVLHEETVSGSLRKLVNTFKKEKMLMHPVIIDRKSGVVLDGTHRVSALRVLGYKYIPVLYVDYFDKHIKLKRWFRVIEGSTEKVLSIVRSLYSFSSISIEDAYFRAMDKILIAMKDKVLIGEKGDIYSKYLMVKRIEEELYKNGIKVLYVPDDHAIEKWRHGKIIMATPILSKRDVVSIAVSGRVFPPKTTRHVFPIRLIFIDFPLDYLAGRFDLDSTRNILREHLLNRVYLRLRGKIAIDRYYEEDYLAMFL